MLRNVAGVQYKTVLPAKRFSRQQWPAQIRGHNGDCSQEPRRIPNSKFREREIPAPSPRGGNVWKPL